MPARKIKLNKLANGSQQPEVEFCDKDKEKLIITGISNRFYMALNIEVNQRTYETTERLWKLHRIDKNCYRWIAMWNTDCHTSIEINGKLQADFLTIDDALKAAINNSWYVCQMNGDNLDWLITFIKSAYGLKI